MNSYLSRSAWWSDWMDGTRRRRAWTKDGDGGGAMFVKCAYRLIRLLRACRTNLPAPCVRLALASAILQLVVTMIEKLTAVRCSGSYSYANRGNGLRLGSVNSLQTVDLGLKR